MVGPIRFLGGFLQHRFGHPIRERAVFERWQDARVRAFLSRILPRSTYYRELFAGRDLKDWRDFPVTDRATLMKHFDNLNTVGMVREYAYERALEAEADHRPAWVGNVRIRLSRGRSGLRALHLETRGDRIDQFAALIGKARHYSLAAENRVAIFGDPAMTLHQVRHHPLMTVRFFDPKGRLAPQLSALARFEPTILIAPPSTLKQLAVARDEGTLRLVAPAVISTGESLDPADRAFIEARLQCRLEEYYEAAEGFLGLSCAAGRIHLNEDLFVVQKERLPGQAERFVPILTDFRRAALPLIRYRLDDILTETRHPCPCRSRFLAIERIEPGLRSPLRQGPTIPPLDADATPSPSASSRH